jgi:PKD repeat protein
VNLGANVTPAQGSNDPAYNPWVINNLNFFTPSGPISGNSLKITIQPGTDFDGLGLAPGYTGYDPFDVNEPNATDAIAVMNTGVSTLGRTGIILEFDYQTGGWLGEDYGTVLYSVDGGMTWTELGPSVTVTYSIIDAYGNTLVNGLTKSAAPTGPTDQNAFSNIDGVASGSYWHRARILLPPACDNRPDLRIGFRWRNLARVSGNSPDYVGVSFNIDNLVLRVNPPVANFTFSPLSPCAGQTVTFDASTSSPGGGTSITTYIWEFPGGTPSNVTTTTPTTTVVFSYSQQDTVKLRVVNNLNDTSAYKTLVINVANCAPRAIINGPYQVCKDSTVQFSDLSLNMSPAYAPLSWSWTFTGGSPASTSGPGPHSVVWNSTGKFSVTLTVSNNYGSDDTTISVDVIQCACVAASSRQNIFIETFGTGCSSGTPANGYNGWIMTNIGTQGLFANTWYVSAEENGNGAGNCGSACGDNRTLHVSTSLGDGGALYLASFWSATNRRIHRSVSTAGYQNIRIDFEYMEYGEGSDDNAVFCYSTNGGSTWNEIDLPKTACCGGAPCDGWTQGVWTAYSITLPASVNNNPNFRIGFRWQNDNDNDGTDPSFAVDNIFVSGDPIGGGGVLWTGNVDDNWHNGGNWSSGTVPTITTDIQIPKFPSGGRMPRIYAANAQAHNVCNYGIITIENNRVLDVDSILLNEGKITTTTTNLVSDVRFVGTNSIYRGSGTNPDVDYEIASGASTTLEANLSCRSLTINSPLTWTNRTITLYKDLTYNGGVTTANNFSTLLLNGPCTSCVDNSVNQSLRGSGMTIPNLIVDKAAGSAIVDASASFSVSNNLHIIRGTLDQTTGVLNGTGNVLMDGGLFRIALLNTTVPQLTGTYQLIDGKVQLYGTGNQTIRGNVTYHRLEFTGSGVKTLGGNVSVRDSLLFHLPVTVGNYVNANGFVLWATNPDPFIVERTGGHVVGDFRRTISPSNTYRFHVGSDNVATPTYYEPIDIQTVGLTPTNYLTISFDKSSPNPITCSLTEYGATFTDLETEGFWRVTPDVQPAAGTYTVTQYPSAGWTFSSVSYTQVKQAAVGSPWTFDMSTRVTALKRKDYVTFSNFGIASSMDPLPTAIILQGTVRSDGQHVLFWTPLREGAQYEVYYQNEGQWERIATTEKPQFQWYPKKEVAYYYVQATDGNGGSFRSNLLELRNVGEGRAQLQVLPNPMQDQVLIVLSTGEDFSWTLFTMDGKKIANGYADHGYALFNSEQLKKGTYLIVATTGQGKVYRTLVVKE